MKELTEKSKKSLKLILEDKGYKNVVVDEWGNVIQVTKKTWIQRLLNRGENESGKIITTLAELSSKAMGLEYDPNEIVKGLTQAWVKDGM